MLRAVIATVRPHQWVKNSFVAAPLVFSKHLGDRDYLARAALAVLAFCLLSAAVYAFNDVCDVEADRAHPRKRHRPIAAGLLSERAGLVLAALLAAVGFGIAVALSPWTAAWGGGYVAMHVLYSVVLKHVAFVDVLVIAAGFILRVAMGGAAIAVTPSPWLLVCTGLVATFLGLGKRAHELTLAHREGRDAAETRASLARYRLGVVRVGMLLLGVATAVAYVLYTIDHHTVGFFGTDRLPWSAPFVVLGLGRFAWLTLASSTKDSPTDAMLRDPLFLVDLAAWAATILVIVYR